MCYPITSDKLYKDEKIAVNFNNILILYILNIYIIFVYISCKINIKHTWNLSSSSFIKLLWKNLRA